MIGEVSETLGPIRYSICCRVWPVATMSRIGNCGLCGNKPTGLYKTAAEASAKLRD